MNATIPQSTYSTEREINALVIAFDCGFLPLEKWTHEAHLTVALYYMQKYSMHEALCLLRARIIKYNNSVGTPNTVSTGYHETITQFWVKIIGTWLKGRSDSLLGLTNRFLASEYASRDYLFQYYSPERIFSAEARATWLAPDLRLLDERLVRQGQSQLAMRA